LGGRRSVYRKIYPTLRNGKERSAQGRKNNIAACVPFIFGETLGSRQGKRERTEVCGFAEKKEKKVPNSPMAWASQTGGKNTKGRNDGEETWRPSARDEKGVCQSKGENQKKSKKERLMKRRISPDKRDVTRLQQEELHNELKNTLPIPKKKPPRPNKETPEGNAKGPNSRKKSNRRTHRQEVPKVTRPAINGVNEGKEGTQSCSKNHGKGVGKTKRRGGKHSVKERISYSWGLKVKRGSWQAAHQNMGQLSRERNRANNKERNERAPRRGHRRIRGPGWRRRGKQGNPRPIAAERGKEGSNGQRS